MSKWRTAVEASLIAVIAGLMVVMFHLLGNTVEDVNSRSVFAWTVARWSDKISFGSDYSHGWIIPLVSALAVWWRRKELARAPRRVAPAGLAIVAFALLLHWVGARIQQPRLSLMGLILLLWGIPYYFYGWQFARHLIFPAGYLIFCIPLNFLDSLTFPLRLLGSAMATGILNGIGIPAVRSGSAIYSAAGGGFHFDVADPCSGLRSLLAMMALIGAYSWFTQKGLARKWLLFLLSVPVAILTNVVRVTTIAIVAVTLGEETALTIYHEYSGYVIFAAAVVMVLLLARLINLDFRARWRQWTHAT